MHRRRAFALIAAAISLTACTADPEAPINQTYPVRQMDTFFRSLRGLPPNPPPPAPPPPENPPDPGYAPAYPPYTPAQ